MKTSSDSTAYVIKDRSDNVLYAISITVVATIGKNQKFPEGGPILELKPAIPLEEQLCEFCSANELILEEKTIVG